MAAGLPGGSEGFLQPRKWKNHCRKFTGPAVCLSVSPLIGSTGVTGEERSGGGKGAEKNVQHNENNFKKEENFKKRPEPSLSTWLHSDLGRHPTTDQAQDFLSEAASLSITL